MEYKLRQRVMRRIYILYGKNFAMQYGEFILPIAFFAGLFAFASVQNIFNNMPKDNLPHAFNFFIVAVRDTEWVLQILLLGVAVWALANVSRFALRRLNSLKNINLLRLRY